MNDEWKAPPEPDAMPQTESPPPAQDLPPRADFVWNLRNGADGWTKDPDEIASLSDKPIIEGLKRDREVGAIVGPAKTAKTWFALALSLAVACGKLFLGLKTYRRKVLYLDYELKEGTFKKRMSMLSPEKPENFYYQCLRGASRLPTVAEITDLVLREGFGLVVIDSLYRTGWLSEENNNDTTSRELTALQEFTRKTGCSMTVVDHTAKGGGNERSAVDAARGASAKGGFFDSLLVLRPTDKGPDPEGHYCILDPVLRDWPKAPHLPLVSFTWTATSCEIELAGEVDRGESDTNTTKVLEVIAGAENGIGRRAIGVAAGLTETTARRVLDDLVWRGKIIEAVDPKHSQRLIYRLPDMGDEPRKTSSNPAA